LWRYLVINPPTKILLLVIDPVWDTLICGVTMVMKSSGFLVGPKRDFGAKKTFESYLSDTERDGMIIV
jgi:hypothetical protein